MNKMQTSVSMRRERTSSEVDEIIQSRHRRQTSANLGKTHFKLAPGLISGSHDRPSSPTSASKQSDHGDAWSQYRRYTARLGVANSYDDAWSRHHASKATSSTIFEEVPRATSKPIMSRLPLEAGQHDAIAAEPTKAGELDYLSTADGEQVAGSHDSEDVAQTVTYTRARLPELDAESKHLWHALHHLQNRSDAYADGYDEAAAANKRKASRQAPHPITQDMDVDDCPAFSTTSSSSSQHALALVRRIFNWNDLPELPIDDENVWYGVAFRSKRRAGSESVNLYEADRRSHEEAVNSGGLLMYWYGSPNTQTGHNLATCVWTNRQDAIRASSLPLHARAAAHALKAYESFELHRYALRKVRGEAKLRVEEWQE